MLPALARPASPPRRHGFSAVPRAEALWRPRWRRDLGHVERHLTQSMESMTSPDLGRCPMRGRHNALALQETAHLVERRFNRAGGKMDLGHARHVGEEAEPDSAPPTAASHPQLRHLPRHGIIGQPGEDLLGRPCPGLPATRAALDRRPLGLDRFQKGRQLGGRTPQRPRRHRRGR